MVFSAKTSYGLVSLLELAAIFRKGGVLQGGEIAQRQGIPDRYLEQMLTSLRRGGILCSIRGPRGGYRLARPPADVSVSEVVRCLEGEASPRDRGLRDSAEFEVLGELAERLESASEAILANTSLQQLVEARDRRIQAQAVYFI